MWCVSTSQSHFFLEESVRFGVAAFAFCRKTQTSSICLCRNACSVVWYLISSAWSRKRRRGTCLMGTKTQKSQVCCAHVGMVIAQSVTDVSNLPCCNSACLSRSLKARRVLGCIASSHSHWTVESVWIDIEIWANLIHFAKLERQNVSDAMSFVTLNACT